MFKIYFDKSSLLFKNNNNRECKIVAQFKKRDIDTDWDLKAFDKIEIPLNEVIEIPFERSLFYSFNLSLISPKYKDIDQTIVSINTYDTSDSLLGAYTKESSKLYSFSDSNDKVLLTITKFGSNGEYAYNFPKYNTLIGQSGLTIGKLLYRDLAVFLNRIHKYNIKEVQNAKDNNCINGINIIKIKKVIHVKEDNFIILYYAKRESLSKFNLLGELLNFDQIMLKKDEMIKI